MRTFQELKIENTILSKLYFHYCGIGQVKQNDKPDTRMRNRETPTHFHIDQALLQMQQLQRQYQKEYQAIHAGCEHHRYRVHQQICARWAALQEYCVKVFNNSRESATLIGIRQHSQTGRLVGIIFMTTI